MFKGKAMSVRSSKSLQTQLTTRKRRTKKNLMNELSLELFNHYNNRNQETLIKLIKANLERIRKRITPYVPISYSFNEVKKIFWLVSRFELASSSTEDQLSVVKLLLRQLCTFTCIF